MIGFKNPQVFQQPISNKYVQVYIGGYTGKCCPKSVLASVYQRTVQHHGDSNRRGWSKRSVGQTK